MDTKKTTVLRKLQELESATKKRILSLRKSGQYPEETRQAERNLKAIQRQISLI